MHVLPNCHKPPYLRFPENAAFFPQSLCPVLESQEFSNLLSMTTKLSPIHTWHKAVLEPSLQDECLLDEICILLEDFLACKWLTLNTFMFCFLMDSLH